MTPLYVTTCARRSGLVGNMLYISHGENSNHYDLLKAAIINDDWKMIDLFLSLIYGFPRNGPEF